MESQLTQSNQMEIKSYKIAKIFEKDPNDIIFDHVIDLNSI